MDEGTYGSMTEDELETMFREYLNETNETVDVGGTEYDYDQVLFSLDTTRFNHEFAAWSDGEIAAGRIVHRVGLYWERGNEPVELKLIGDDDTNHLAWFTVPASEAEEARDAIEGDTNETFVFKTWDGGHKYLSVPVRDVRRVEIIAASKEDGAVCHVEID